MKSRILLSVLVVLCALTIAASADISKLISYQGSLLDGVGNPVADGAYLIQFQIYDAPSGGDIKWSSATRKITVSGGQFQYNLGDTVALPGNLFASDTALWLGVKVGADPELTPRTRLTASGYAFQALRADTAAISANVYDNAITSTKIATNAVGASELQGNSVAGANIIDGEVAEVDLAFDVATQTELNTHQSNASAHHTKTNSASELILGTLSDTRLSSNVPLKNAGNTFSNINTFQSSLRVGDSTLWADNGAIRIGDGGAPTSTSLIYMSRTWNSAGILRGIYNEQENVAGGTLYGMESSATGITPGGGGVVYGVVARGRSDGSSRHGLWALGEAQDFTITTGLSYGVYGRAHDGATAYGVYGDASGAVTNWAGYFNGNCNVVGTLSKGGGSFRIDHPLDPENKYLQHSFVESPDMMNIYNGNVFTDGAGYATVTLPDYFDALNRDFRYQLTVIGEFAQAIVAEKISGGQFTIRTDMPNIEVSWQVTGVRKDRWAEANRIEVEPEKPEHEKGYYMHYQAWNQPVERAIDREALLAAQKNRDDRRLEKNR